MDRKLGDGLFLQCCEEVAELYPKIKFETMIIDNCCMQVRPPHISTHGAEEEGGEWNLLHAYTFHPLAGAESLPV